MQSGSSQPSRSSPSLEPQSALERSIIRYYTTGILLRVRTPVETYWKEEYNNGYGYLGTWDPHDVFRTPPLCAIPPFKRGKEKHYAASLFVIIPAEGISKEKGEPVYIGDPVQLMDDSGRVLSCVDRFPYSKHIGPDGQGDSLVFIFHLYKNGETSEMDSYGVVKHDRKILPKRLSMLELSNGDMVVLPGVRLCQKKNFLGGSLILGEDIKTSRDGGTTASGIVCEIVLKNRTMESIAMNDRCEDSKMSIHADRTATGKFIGALHSGKLYKRMAITKKWKPRIFVLTHIALHYFLPLSNESNHPSRKQNANNTSPLTCDPDFENNDLHKLIGKERGIVPLKCIKKVTYEQFSSPHNIEIELFSGKLIYLHSPHTVECSQWTKILASAMENPEWIHSDGTCATIWRSDRNFTSSKCPTIDRICLKLNAANGVYRVFTLSESPGWDETISLGSLSFGSSIQIHLKDPSFLLEVTLEELNHAILQPVWTVEQSFGSNSDLQGCFIRVKFQSKVSVQPWSGSSAHIFTPIYTRYTFIQKRIKVLSYVHSYLRMKLRIFSGQTGGIVSFFSISGANVITYLFWGWRSMVLLNSIITLLFGILYSFLLRYPSPKEIHNQVHWCIQILAVEVRPEDGSYNSVDRDDSQGNDLDGSDISDITSESNVSDLQGFVYPSPSYWETSSLIQSSDEHERDFAIQRWRTTYEFRMENGLDSILYTPHLSYFPIKKYCVHKFLEKNRLGNRVLLIKLQEVDWISLKRFGIFSVEIFRHFLYIWEFLWSNADPEKPTNHLMLLVDGSEIGGGYMSNGSGIAFIRSLIAITTKHYPGCITKIVLYRFSHWWTRTVWMVLKSSLDQPARDICVEVEENSKLLDLISPSFLPTTYGGLLEDDNDSEDDLKLSTFVSERMVSMIQASIEAITKEEIDHATAKAKNIIQHTNEYGDCMILLDEPKKCKVLSCSNTHSILGNGRMELFAYYHFNTISGEQLMDMWHDPYKRQLWDDSILQYIILDAVSNQEDIFLLSRSAKVTPAIITLVGRRYLLLNRGSNTHALLSKVNRKDIAIHHENSSSPSNNWKSDHPLSTDQPPSQSRASSNSSGERSLGSIEENEATAINANATTTCIYIEDAAEGGCSIFFSTHFEMFDIPEDIIEQSKYANAMLKTLESFEKFASD